MLRLIALGHTSVEIAAKLHLSPRTIETHRAHIHKKLGAAARARASVRYALRRVPGRQLSAARARPLSLSGRPRNRAASTAIGMRGLPAISADGTVSLRHERTSRPRRSCRC